MRAVLANSLGLDQFAVHDYRDLPKNIPENCAVQIHWYREPHFQRFLSSNKFHIIVLARHPLDVLISALRFAKYEPDVSRWLDGNVEIPSHVIDKSPVSAEFLQYATSWGAENLLSVTYQWWHDPSVLKAKYEDIVLDPIREFSRLVDRLNEAPSELNAAINKFSLPTFQNTPNKHGWQGCPGLWRQLIPFIDALQIYKRHRNFFNLLGYSIHPTLLSRRSAQRNWQRLST